jgi:succinate dehydrogenase / fumarate reductase membrane anchor subunit
MSLRTPLARAKGLGSAKEGVSHWWAQRVTAMALVPLCLWMVISVIGLVGGDHGAVVAWLQSPVQTALLVLLLIAMFYHAKLGLQVVIEDYVHAEGPKTATLIAMNFAVLFLGATAVMSVLRIAFGGV